MNLKELYVLTKEYTKDKIYQIMLSLVSIGLIIGVLSMAFEKYENMFTAFIQAFVIAILVGSLAIEVYLAYREERKYRVLGYLFVYSDYLVAITSISLLVAIVNSFLSLVLNMDYSNSLLSLILNITYFFVAFFVIVASLIVYLSITVESKSPARTLKYSLNFSKKALGDLFKISVKYLWIPFTLIVVAIVTYMLTTYPIVDLIISNPEMYYVLERNTLTFLMVSLLILIFAFNRITYLLGAYAIYFDRHSSDVTIDW